MWITIITHVSLWNFIFSLSESVELNEDSKLLRSRVRYSTRICDCLKNAPPAVDHNNYKSLPDSEGVVNFENPGLAKDLSKQSSCHVKRHAILRSYNRPSHENNKPYKPDLITSEWQMKSALVNNANGDSMVQKSKVVRLNKNVINSQNMVYHEPLHHTAVPLLQKGNLIAKNSKPSLLQLSLQDTTTQIKSLIAAPKHKLVEIISDKLVDGSLDNKLTQPSLTLPLPYKSIKHSVINPLVRPTEKHNNVDTAGLITENSDKQSNSLKLSTLSPHISNKEKGLITEDKPFSPLLSINLNKPKLVSVLYDRKILPVANRPTPSQLIQTPVIKPIHMPIFEQNEVSISSTNERPHVNIGSSSQYPKIIKNVNAESTSPPILTENAVSIPLSSKKQLKSIDSPPTQQFIKTSDTETVHKPIKIEKDVSISAPNEQKTTDS